MITTINTPLKVPFKEKDEAKSLGARWNPTAKHWYIPEGLDDAPFIKWLDGTTTESASIPAPEKVKNSTTTILPHADLDDINAMLRDAAESHDDSSL